MSKRFLYTSVAALAVTAVWMGTSASPVHAFPEFKAGFMKEYVKPDSTEDKDVEFKKAANAANCAICHEGKTKKVRNAYGKALEAYLKPSDKKNADKIKESLESAAKDHTVAGDTTSPTFGDKIAEGKLPAGKK